jgi:hypothetical protein
VPALPASLTVGENGQVLVTERPAPAYKSEWYGIPDSELPLYESQPATEAWQARIEEVAAKVGMTTEQLLTARVSHADIVADTTLPRGVRQLSESKDGEIMLTQALREIQGHALDQAYVQTLANHGRTILEEYMPEAAPQEQTLVAAQERGPGSVGTYHGRYGGHEALAETKNCPDAELVIVAAHEFAHQKHAEISGLDTIFIADEHLDKTQYDTHHTTDPHEALDMFADHVLGYGEHHTPQQLQASKVALYLSELYAYTVEEELRARAGMPQKIVNGGEGIASGAGYRDMLLHFLVGSNGQQRAEIMQQVAEVDIAALVQLPDEQLQAALDDPRKLLELPKRTA